MTDERIQRIKSAVEAADHISPEKKTELLAVLAKLKPAIAEVASSGKLTGFAGGLDAKAHLLKLEGHNKTFQQILSAGGTAYSSPVRSRRRSTG